MTRAADHRLAIEDAITSLITIVAAVTTTIIPIRDVLAALIHPRRYAAKMATWVFVGCSVRCSARFMYPWFVQIDSSRLDSIFLLVLYVRSHISPPRLVSCFSPRFHRCRALLTRSLFVCFLFVLSWRRRRWRAQGDEFYENGGGMGPPPRRTRGGPPRRFFNRRSFRGGYRPLPRRPNTDYQVSALGVTWWQLRLRLKLNSRRAAVILPLFLSAPRKYTRTSRLRLTNVSRMKV